MAVQTDKLKRMFESDSKIMLDTLRQLVSEMTGGSADPRKVDRAFRAAHSIKSEAGFLELSSVAAAAHALEGSLATLRSGAAAGPAITRLEGELEELSRAISDYHASQPASDSTREETPVVSEALGLAEKGMLREAKGRNEKLFRVSLELTCDPEFYYPRGFLAVNNLELQCGVVQTVPSLEGLKGSDGRLSVLLTTSGDEALLRRLLTVDEVLIADISELAYSEVEQAFTETSPERQETPDKGRRVNSKTQDELMLLVEELGNVAGDLSKLVGEGEASGDELRAVSRQISMLSGVLKARVDWASRVQLLDGIRELRDSSVAHAARSGKRLRFVVSGGGAVVFSAVAATLTDSILHLVRNSIDHGIETIQRRASRGKPPAGTIGIAVDQAGNTVRVRVSDDGIGIEEGEVRRRAGDPERSLLEVLSTPGFTLRDEADQSSGRGVGLDSVVHAVRDLLSGDVSLTTEPGRGTTVELTVPSTSRLMDVLVVDTADGPAALPSALIVDRQPLNLRRFKRDSFGSRYYDYHGRSLPLLTVFGRDPDDDAFRGEPVGIVVRCGTRHAVLLASGVISTEAVVRDGVRRRRVFSKTLGREVPFVFPPTCLGK